MRILKSDQRPPIWLSGRFFGTAFKWSPAGMVNGSFNDMKCENFEKRAMVTYMVVLLLWDSPLMKSIEMLS